MPQAGWRGEDKYKKTDTQIQRQRQCQIHKYTLADPEIPDSRKRSVVSQVTILSDDESETLETVNTSKPSGVDSLIHSSEGINTTGLCM